MFDVKLVISALGASVAAGMFLAAGLSVRQRPVTPDARAATHLLAVWWLGLCIYAVASASSDLIAALGVNPFSLFLVFAYTKIVALCIGLWGLMYYLAFVFTGERRFMAPLAVFYSLYYALILFFLTLGQPMGMSIDPWPRLELATPVMDTLAAALLLIIPPLVASLTFLSLLSKASHVSQRYRIVLICVGTLAWFAGSLAREAAVSEAAIPISLGLLSAWAVSWAYLPPTWIKKRWDEPSVPT